jgi:hypothetical protein
VLSLLKGEAYNLEDAYAVTKLQLEEEAEKAAAAAAAAAAASAGDGADGASKPAVPGADQLAAGGAAGGAEAQAGGAGVEKLSRRAKAARDKAVAAVKAKRRELEESRVDPQVGHGLGPRRRAVLRGLRLHRGWDLRWRLPMPICMH